MTFNEEDLDRLIDGLDRPSGMTSGAIKAALKAAMIENKIDLSQIARVFFRDGEMFIALKFEPGIIDCDFVKGKANGAQ